MSNERILTGIKPTGHPHIGNLYGAILPSLELSNTQLTKPDHNLFFYNLRF